MKGVLVRVRRSVCYGDRGERLEKGCSRCFNTLACMAAQYGITFYIGLLIKNIAYVAASVAINARHMSVCGLCTVKRQFTQTIYANILHILYDM